MTDPVNFNYTAWFQNSTPSWTPKDTQLFLGRLFKFLGELVTNMTDTAKITSDQMKETEAE